MICTQADPFVQFICFYAVLRNPDEKFFLSHPNFRLLRYIHIYMQIASLSITTNPLNQIHMNNTKIKSTVVLVLAGLLMSSLTWAQGDKANRPSPPKTATGKVNGATITINYSSPAVNNRKIFGELLPYGQVWRAGANEATLFETDKDIKVEGKTLPVGKYSLYAIPNEKEWTIIFNKQTGQWGVKRGGATSREEAQDALTVKVKPKKSSSLTERLAYDVTDKGFTLRWENVEVPVAIK